MSLVNRAFCLTTGCQFPTQRVVLADLPGDPRDGEVRTYDPCERCQRRKLIGMVYRNEGRYDFDSGELAALYRQGYCFVRANDL